MWWRMLAVVCEGVGMGVGIGLRETFRGLLGRSNFFWTDIWVGGALLRIRFSRLFELVEHRWCTVEDMAQLGWEKGGEAWKWTRRFFAWEEESVHECVLLLHNGVAGKCCRQVEVVT